MTSISQCRGKITALIGCLVLVLLLFMLMLYMLMVMVLLLLMMMMWMLLLLLLLPLLFFLLLLFWLLLLLLMMMIVIMLDDADVAVVLIVVVDDDDLERTRTGPHAVCFYLEHQGNHNAKITYLFIFFKTTFSVHTKRAGKTRCLALMLVMFAADLREGPPQTIWGYSITRTFFAPPHFFFVNQLK